MQIVMEEEPHLTLMRGVIHHFDLAYEEVFVKVHRIATDQVEPKVRMCQGDLGHPRIRTVLERARPGRIIHPTELILHPDSESEYPTRRMVLESDVGPIHLADLVRGIEAQEQGAVCQWEVTRHAINPLKVEFRRSRDPRQAPSILQIG